MSSQLCGKVGTFTRPFSAFFYPRFSHFSVVLLESFHHTWVVRLAIRRVRESHR
jgi:hypothetical protein